MKLDQNNMHKATAQLAIHVAETKRNLKSACLHALYAGCSLIYLRDLDLTTFRKAIDSVLLNERTARRWVNATYNALAYLEIRDFENVEFGSARWNEILAQLEKVAEEFTLSRLQLGAPAAKGDLMRMEIITRQAETSESEQNIYSQALEKVEQGDWTLVQAVRAIGAQEAAEKISEAKKAAAKQAELLIDVDSSTGEVVGAIPTALKRLQLIFEKWEVLDATSRELARQQWKNLLLSKPADL